MNKLFLGAAGACALALSPAFAEPAEAAVVYTNGAPPPAGSGGSDVSSYWVAEDFTLTSDADLTAASIYIGNPEAWDTGVQWVTFFDNNGAPGSVYNGGGSGAISVTDTGIAWAGGGNVHKVTFSLGGGAIYTAGTTYWLAVNLLQTMGQTSEPHWVHTTANGTASGQRFLKEAGMVWESTGAEHAFELAAPDSAVPEPSTWAMLIVGFGAVGWSLRRRPARRAVQVV